MAKHVLLGSIVLGALFVSQEAHAFEFGTPASEHPFRSPQNFALEFRVSPYYPAVDDEPGLGGKTPFKDRFGDKARIYFGIEFDWQALRIPYIGTLALGASFGSVTMSRPAVTVTGRPSGDEYGLTIYPLFAGAVLRVDTLWRGAGIPVVPYGKVGPALGLWSASNGAGTSRSDDGVKGSGATWGTNAALGVAFPLDALDQGASRNMDNATGINNTYIFAEGYWLNLSGIGQDSALRVGTTSWAAGLAFEF